MIKKVLFLLTLIVATTQLNAQTRTYVITQIRDVVNGNNHSWFPAHGTIDYFRGNRFVVSVTLASGERHTLRFDNVSAPQNPSPGITRYNATNPAGRRIIIEVRREQIGSGLINNVRTSIRFLNEDRTGVDFIVN